MRYHVLTLFPELVEYCMNTSITGRAIKEEKLQLNTVNIRNFTKEKHGHVDDYPYGGGAGMVMQVEPVYLSYKYVEEDIKKISEKKPKVLYMSPGGRVFNQDMAKELAKEEDIVFICGHYEGIDERTFDLIEAEPVSIGDYVLTGGEIPAVVIMDAVSRMVEGVLGNKESSVEESFSGNILEYPQYTRPEEYMGLKVPAILLSGNHKKVEEWRREQALERTRKYRPDLLKGELKDEEE